MNKKQEVLLLAMREKIENVEELEKRGYNIKKIFIKDKLGYRKLRVILVANRRKASKK